MRKLIILACFALAAALTLSGCQKEQAAPVAAPVVKPTSASDTTGWKKYLVDVVKQNMKGMTSNRPYLYFIPGGDNDAAVSQRQNQFDNVNNVVRATVLPGNLMAFGGPESAKTADLIIGAFKDATAGSFKGVIVLFIGDQADKQRVADGIAASGAEYRFVQM
ncbi:MAG TPA: hypothetical protein VFN09_08960 [Rhodanobacteraceae bacterium]|nr:hypothetical protein [Rhodanobacteraceae bacterium]